MVTKGFTATGFAIVGARQDGSVSVVEQTALTPNQQRLVLLVLARIGEETDAFRDALTEYEDAEAQAGVGAV